MTVQMRSSFRSNFWVPQSIRLSISVPDFERIGLMPQCVVRIREAFLLALGVVGGLRRGWYLISFVFVPISAVTRGIMIVHVWVVARSCMTVTVRHMSVVPQPCLHGAEYWNQLDASAVPVYWW